MFSLWSAEDRGGTGIIQRYDVNKRPPWFDQIICEIDNSLCSEFSEAYPGDFWKLTRVRIIDNGRTVIERDLESIREGINKVQTAFAEDREEAAEEAIANLNVLHREKHGSVELLITRDNAERIEEILSPAEPLIMDVLPLSLEEVFIYELGGEKYDFSEIL